MKPLQSIAMGLVIIALKAWVNGEYDVLPDPIGWLLVLQGLAALPGIADYLASDRRIAFNEDGIFRHYPELDSK